MLKTTKQKLYKIIRKSERFFQTDMIYLLKGSGWLGVSNVVSSALTFLLAIAFANLLPAETYGVYRYVIAVTSILALFSLNQLNTAVARSVARGYEGSSFTGMKVKFRWSLIGAASAILLGGYYLYQSDPTLGWSFIVAGLLLPFFNTFNTFGYFLNGKGLFKERSILAIITKAISVGSLVVVILLTNSVTLLVATYFGVSVLLSLLFTYLVFTKHQPNEKTEEGMVSYGKHLSIMGAVQGVANYLDKVLLWHFLGPLEVALFAFAQAPVETLRQIIKKSLGTTAFTKLSKKDFDTTRRTLPTKINKLFLLIVPIMVVYIIATPYIYNILFPQYVASIPFAQVLALMLLGVPFTFYNSFLLAQAKQKDLYITDLTVSFTLIISLLIFTPLWGIWGVVLAKLTREIVKAIVLYIYAR